MPVLETSALDHLATRTCSLQLTFQPLSVRFYEKSDKTAEGELPLLALQEGPLVQVAFHHDSRALRVVEDSMFRHSMNIYYFLGFFSFTGFGTFS